ncbi:phosphotriesterase family protein [Actinomycetospora termitidis]|uniref:Phosphotriesterase-related protein n=1 Tax=Actinomycetospora termitidis TaxID=3053470 RepID=A0ABT7M118_9PSEU|nr:phosphotriesterase-related protein [Actinomycetospora sp. Odt1-22]MDL5154357.1 phosphotriesterase-related protein [Actinomycetospora sp. Odt1-22]
MVDTVRGPVDVADLGTTLMHEHVFVLTPDLLANQGHEYWDEELRVADAVDKLRRLRDLGVKTIVDPTVVGLGRYVPRVARVNADVDLNIVVATGLYTFAELPRQIQNRGPGSLLGGDDPLTGMFLRDVREGIGGTGIRAALLKGVVEAAGITPDLARVHRAIAATHRETGVPIIVHTNAEHRTGTLVLDLYDALGVDLTKVVVGHAGDSNDLDYLRSLADRGAMLGCDRFGLDRYNTTERRVATVAALCAEGYADRISLSHDASCYIDFYAGEQAQRALRAAAPNWHYEHISRDVLPALRAAGVTDAQITTMMVDNPRHWFTPAG